MCLLMRYLYFYWILVFSDHEMKKGNDRIMVESEGYHKIVCCFHF